MISDVMGRRRAAAAGWEQAIPLSTYWRRGNSALLGGAPLQKFVGVGQPTSMPRQSGLLSLGEPRRQRKDRQKSRREGEVTGCTLGRNLGTFFVRTSRSSLFGLRYRS